MAPASGPVKSYALFFLTLFTIAPAWERMFLAQGLLAKLLTWALQSRALGAKRIPKAESLETQGATEQIKRLFFVILSVAGNLSFKAAEILQTSLTPSRMARILIVF